MSNISTLNLKPRSISTIQYAATSNSGSAGQKLGKISTKTL